MKNIRNVINTILFAVILFGVNNLGAAVNAPKIEVSKLPCNENIEKAVWTFGKPIVIRQSGSVISFSTGQTTELWDVQTRKCLHRFGTTDFTAPVKFSQDGKFVIFHGRKVAEVHDTQTGQCIYRVDGTDLIHKIEISQDGKIVVVCYGEKVMRYDIQTGNVQVEENSCDLDDSCESYRLAAMRISPEGRVVAFGHDVVVELFDKKTKKVLFNFYCDSRVRSIEFSQDGSQIIVAHSNGTVTVFTDTLFTNLLANGAVEAMPWKEVFGR